MGEGEMNESRIFICAPATGDLMVTGTSFDRVCSKCNQRVMVSPSGQARLKAEPAAVIICLKCFKPPARYDAELSAGTREGLAAELATIQPNTWKDRN
jgi:hypothetical protein